MQLLFYYIVVYYIGYAFEILSAFQLPTLLPIPSYFLFQEHGYQDPQYSASAVFTRWNQGWFPLPTHGLGTAADINILRINWVWSCTPLVPKLDRQMQEGLC